MYAIKFSTKEGLTPVKSFRKSISRTVINAPAVAEESEPGPQKMAVASPEPLLVIGEPLPIPLAAKNPPPA